MHSLSRLNLNGKQPPPGFESPVKIPIEGELDLHTFRPQDVKEVVSAYLEACRERGILKVRIIHGKGIGTLRQTVHALLRRSPDVQSFALAGEALGSWGATIVCLRPLPANEMDNSRIGAQRMKVLLLNQTFWPDVASTAQHLAGLAAALARREHMVTVLTSSRSYDNPRQRFSKREFWQGVQVRRLPTTGFGKSAPWRRAADFAVFLAACALRLALMPRQDAVVALTSPPLISLLACWAARLWRARFTYWVMDLNPDEAVAAGWLRADSWFGKALEMASRISLRSATTVVALDHFMAERIAAKGVAAEKIAIIQPWSQDAEVRFDPVGRTRFRREHGLEDRFVVMYSGNHSPCHPLDTLLAAARQLRNDPTIAFCFVGGGSEFVRVQRFAASERLPNILCLPYQPLDQLAASLSAADLQVVVMGNTFVGLVHPCKIYNILSVGAPVLYIGPEPSHVTEILGALGPALPSASARHGEVDRVLSHLAHLRSQSTRMPRLDPPTPNHRFTASALLPRLVAVIEGTCPPAGACVERGPT